MSAASKSNETLVAYLATQGYTHVRVLPDGTIAGLVELMFTTGLCMGLNETSWQKRYCFEQRSDAMDALQGLTSLTDEPSGWIARRPQDPCDQRLPKP